MGCKGRSVIESLAARFPQLYVAPAEGADAISKRAATTGIAPEGATLDHFITSEDDEFREVETPAGKVEVVFLKNRADFETFLQIIGHRSQPVPIARTVGAMTYLGLPDWGEVKRLREAYIESGGEDWSQEFSRLAKQPGTFRAEIIIISEGPYSNIAASDAGYGEEEWVVVSREIRLHHECAHVVCRRTMPGDVLPVWDEVTADVVGLISATGRYNAQLAMRFLGVSDEGYVQGRLAEYLDEEQAARIDEVAREVAGACTRIEGEATAENRAHPFDFLIELKEKPFISY